MLEPPKNLEMELEQSFTSSLHTRVQEILAKVQEILIYLKWSRLIPGDGIRLMETPTGVQVSADPVRRKSSASSIRKSEPASPEYTGPWGLSFYGNDDSLIRANPGLIWTPDGTKYGSGIPPTCQKPNVSSLVIVSWDYYHAVISSMSGDLKTYTEQNPHYWDSHAILGRYDAESDSLMQYHFSPVVFFISTEDFVIEP